MPFPYGIRRDDIDDGVDVEVLGAGAATDPFPILQRQGAVERPDCTTGVDDLLRTSAVGEFKISYSKLGPTEIRVFAILLNTAMYFGGVQTSLADLGPFSQIPVNPYDLFLAILALLLLCFFIVTAIQETRKLAKENK